MKNRKLLNIPLIASEEEEEERRIIDKLTRLTGERPWKIKMLSTIPDAGNVGRGKMKSAKEEGEEEGVKKEEKTEEI